MFDYGPIIIGTNPHKPMATRCAELATNHQTLAWVSCQGHQSEPPPEADRGKNKVDDERRALKPGGPSRALAASSKSITRGPSIIPLGGQVRLWAIRQLGLINEIHRTFALNCVT
jgi:hypothetical protein